ncbi:MAG TPA: glycosyltransferase family 4 protein [Vicinamibacterales bacterium]|nr:glycosyltransferase family 4 protein [Vicinamibacterales bacterium]
MRSREGQSLRVAILARSVYPLHCFGGLERHVYDLVRCLLARDLRITLITPPAAKHRPSDANAEAVFRHPNLTMSPVPYVTFPFANRRGTTILDRSTAYPLFGLRAGRAAARMVSAGEIDIVHGLGASVLGYALADLDKKTRAPLVFNPQGLEEFGATDPSRAPVKRLAYWPLRVAVRRAARSADRVIATDRSIVAPVLAHLGVSKDVVRVVPNAIELAECDRPDSPSRAQALRTEIGLQPDDLLFVSVGRLEANKGFHVLVRALGALVRQKALPEKWRWVLVGDGPMRETLERAIESEGIAPWVVMRGRSSVDDLHGWYEAATMFVHPTLYEGSSLVTLEAMAHRKAVIAGRAGGLPDKVIPGVTGWLVPPGNEEALAATITKAIADSSKLQSMGAAGRALVEKEFSWRAATDRLLAVYGELVDRRDSL